MRLIAAAVALGFALLSGTLGFLGRYEIVTGTGTHFYVVDRWTGRVQDCLWVPLVNVAAHSACAPVFPPVPFRQ